MAVIVGNDGNITLPTAHGAAGAVLHTWRVRFTNTITEVTGFAHTVFRRNRGGLIGIEGSASGQCDSSIAPAVDAIAAAGSSMTLTAQSGNTWVFTGLISAIGFDTNKRDNSAQITFDFVGGDIASEDFVETWA